MVGLGRKFVLSESEEKGFSAALNRRPSPSGGGGDGRLPEDACAAFLKIVNVPKSTNDCETERRQFQKE